MFTVIIYPITQILEFIFIFSEKTFKETGISIIFISLTVSIITLPLYNIAEKWQNTERDIQKRLSNKIKKIKSAFKGDEQYMLISAYYRQNNYHPIFALRSLLGLLVQIPFFIAAFYYLSNLELLKGSSFYFLNDLSKPDLFLLSIMTLINIVSSTVYAFKLPLKEKIQLYITAIIFFILLYKSPSALVLYWTINNLFSLFKNIYNSISFKYKKYIIYAVISLFCLSISFYLLFIHQGYYLTRLIIISSFILIGISPWLASISKKYINKISLYGWTKSEIFYYFIFSVLILWILTGVFIPSMLIASSPQEFSFLDSVNNPLYFIFMSSAQSFGLWIFWPFAVFLLFNDTIKRNFSYIFFAVSASALCNVFLFPGNYGFLGNDLVFSAFNEPFLKEIIVNLSITFLIFIIIFVLFKFGLKRILSLVSVSLFSALACFSIFNMYQINIEYNKLSQYYTPVVKTEETIEPVLQLSKTGKNVLIIVLDHAASVFLPFIFEESPDLYRQYTGFVYYPNTVSFHARTTGSAPAIYGGYESTPQSFNSRPDITITEKKNQSLLLMPYNFSENNFSVTLTDPPHANNNWIPDLRIFDNLDISTFITEDGRYTDLWLSRNNIKLPAHSSVLKRNILWYSIFRLSPLALRSAIYRHGSWCSPFSEYRMRNFLNCYAVLDLLPELTDFNPVKENSFTVLYNNTTHESYLLQAPDYTPSLYANNSGTSPFKNEVWYHSNIAAIKRLGEFFEYLKENETYDNTRIIIVSDHGVINMSFVTKLELPFHVDNFNPLLLVKDFNSYSNLHTDMSFMSNADVPSIAMEYIIKNPLNPFTGNNVSKERKKEPLLIVYDQYLKEKDDYLIDLTNSYYIHTNIFEINNWTPANQ